MGWETSHLQEIFIGTPAERRGILVSSCRASIVEGNLQKLHKRFPSRCIPPRQVNSTTKNTFLATPFLTFARALWGWTQPKGNLGVLRSPFTALNYLRAGSGSYTG